MQENAGGAIELHWIEDSLHFDSPPLDARGRLGIAFDLTMNSRFEALPLLLAFGACILLACCDCSAPGSQVAQAKVERVDEFREFGFKPGDRVYSLDACLDEVGRPMGTLSGGHIGRFGNVTEFGLWFWRWDDGPSASLRISPLVKDVMTAKVCARPGNCYVVYARHGELHELTSGDGGRHWRERLLLKLDDGYRVGPFAILAITDTTQLVTYVVERQLERPPTAPDSVIGLYACVISSDSVGAYETLLRVPDMTTPGDPDLAMSNGTLVMSFTFGHWRSRHEGNIEIVSSLPDFVVASRPVEGGAWSILARPRSESGGSPFGGGEKSVVSMNGETLRVYSWRQGSVMKVASDGQPRFRRLHWIDAASTWNPDGFDVLRRGPDDVIAWTNEGRFMGPLRWLMYGGPKDNELRVRTTRAAAWDKPVLGRELRLMPVGSKTDHVSLLSDGDRAFVVWMGIDKIGMDKGDTPPTLRIATLRFE